MPDENPGLKTRSSVPWWGSILVIIIGVVCWCVGAKLGVPGIDEAGRVLVYVPVGNLFGMSLKF